MTDARSESASPAARAAVADTPAAGTPCGKTDALSRALCRQAQLVSSTCDDVADPARGHCVRCLLANNPVACEALPADAAAQCRLQQAAIARCTDGPADAAEACLRDAGVALFDRPALRLDSRPRFPNSKAAP